MAIHFEEVDLPYAPRQVFDLVADIESYPRFLTHVAAARITHRDGNTLWVDQVVRLKMMRLRFSTRAELEPTSRIDIVCSDSPFGTFHDVWQFADAPAGGTRLSCRTDFEFRSAILGRVLGAALGDVLKTTVRAFELRAKHLYNGALPPA